MGKAFCWLLVLMLSVSLSQSEECSCRETNSAAITNKQDEESLNQLRQQMEYLNSSNEKLLHQIEMLIERLNRIDVLIYVQNASVLSHDEKIAVAQDTSSFETNQNPRKCANVTVQEPSKGNFIIDIVFIEKIPCKNLFVGDWTVIQRRQDGSVDFYRNWIGYKMGFGDVEGEFFIGLYNVHVLTKESPQELLIIMIEVEGRTSYAKYDSFAIGDENEAYALKVLGNYSGDAGDSLRDHVGQKFSTYDRDNDNSTRNCAETHKGAWWYADCCSSNLNGIYLMEKDDLNINSQGINWLDRHGHKHTLKFVQMMIRPRKN